MAHDVFISYSHIDKSIADAICANLETRGVRCWIAPRDIAPGLDWPTAISEAIAASRIMVLVFSTHSNSSNDVGRELILAANTNLVIIPFKLDNIAPEPGKQYYLARTHWLDAMNPPTQEQIDTLVSYVKSFLGVAKSPATVAALPKEELVYPKQTSRIGTTAGGRKTGRKNTWLWVTLLLLAVIGGVLGAVRLFGERNAPIAATPTRTTTQLIPGTETSTAPVTITIWHDVYDNDVVYYKEIFTEYMAEHPNVTIVFTSCGCETEWTTILSAAILSGQGPDLVVGGADIPENVEAGNIVPLDEYGITQDWLRNVYEPVPANGMLWAGKIWGLPVRQFGVAIIYNKALASASDFPANPTDFTNLHVMAQDFYESKGIPLFSPGAIGSFFLSPVIFGFGVPTFVDERGTAYLDIQQSVDAMDWLLEMKPYMLAETDYPSLTSAMEQGRVAATWNGFWAVQQLKAAGIETGILSFGKPWVSLHQTLLTQNAVDRGHAQVAVDIMEYFTSADAQKKILLSFPDPDTSNFIPTNTATLEDPQVLVFSNIASFRLALNRGTPMTLYPGVDIISPLESAITSIWNGEQTPDEALSAAQAAVEAQIAQDK